MEAISRSGHARNPVGQLTLTAALLCAAVLPGCGASTPLGPWEYPTVSLSGTITIAGQPASAGWVTVLPTGPTTGDHTIGRIRAGGAFDIPDAPIGPLIVWIEIPRDALPPALVARRDLLARLQLFSGPSSPLRTITQAGATNRFDFDLVFSQIPKRN